MHARTRARVHTHVHETRHMLVNEWSWHLFGQCMLDLAKLQIKTYHDYVMRIAWNYF